MQHLSPSFSLIECSFSSSVAHGLSWFDFLIFFCRLWLLTNREIHFRWHQGLILIGYLPVCLNLGPILQLKDMLVRSIFFAWCRLKQIALKLPFSISIVTVY